MNETRKIYRMHAELAKKQGRQVHMLPEDLLALVEDSEELERVAQGLGTRAPFVHVDLDKLETLARASKSSTVPGAHFAVLVPGAELLELCRLLRAYATLRCQCIHSQVGELLGPVS